MDFFEELVDAARRGCLNFGALEAFCVATNTEIQIASNSLARHFAEAFLAGTVEFDDCDQAMNSLFSVMASEPYFKLTDRVIPEFAFGVYQAFDAGEFYRQIDLPNDIPSVKYTIPMLRQILGGLHAV